MRGCASTTFCCRICGKSDAEESIEHFAFCKKVQMVAEQIFHLPTAANAISRSHHLQSFLCLDTDYDKTELRRRALFLQVVKYLFEICKNSGPPTSDFQLLDMSRLLLHRATRGGGAIRRKDSGRVALLRLGTAEGGREGPSPRPLAGGLQLAR